MNQAENIYVILKIDIHQNPVATAVNSFTDQEAAIKCMTQLENQNQDFEHQYFQIQKVGLNQPNNQAGTTIDFLSQWVQTSHALERSYQMLQSNRKNKVVTRIKHGDLETIKHYLNHNNAIMAELNDEIKSKQ